MNIIDRIRTAPKGTQVSFIFPITEDSSGEDVCSIQDLQALVKHYDFLADQYEHLRALS